MRVVGWEHGGYGEEKIYIVACLFSEEGHSFIVCLYASIALLVIPTVSFYGSIAHKVAFEVFYSPIFKPLHVVCDEELGARVGWVKAIGTIYFLVVSILLEP